MSKKRVCYVVCYRDPSYTRTNSLINALSLIEGTELKIVKNRYRNFFRYIEVPLKLLVARLVFQPDTFIVGFRANEIFWALYPSMIGKKIVFDEFVNLHDWMINEHHKLKTGSVFAKLLDGYMCWVTSRSRKVLVDTPAHAKLAENTYNLPKSKILAVPVGADEKVFYPRPKAGTSSKFEVFFYGTVLPLHGIKVILEAAKIAATKNKKLHFSIIGGRGNQQFLDQTAQFIKSNKLSRQVSLEPWVKYDELPERIGNSSLCLGGPFGGTGQAKRVIAGKTYQFLAMSKPVVVGEGESSSDFVDGSNCLLVEQNSPQKLADTVLWASTNPDKLESIGKAGRKLYDSKFSSRAIGKLLSEVI